MQEERNERGNGELNPRFLFSCTLKRTEDETNYHAHDFIELVVVLRGEGRFCADGEEYETGAGTLLVLNPGTYHRSLLRPGSTSPAVECYLAFTGVEFRGCEKGKMPLFGGCSIRSEMPEGLRQEVFRLCAAIEQEAAAHRPGRDDMLRAYLIQVLCLLGRAEEARRAQAMPVRQPGYIFQSTNKKYVVGQIRRYLEEHYREKISLDQIAANMYLSAYYISKIFKSETGDTPINYVISLRMAEARALLDADPTASIQSVAAAVGYEDAYHFSKLFKKYYGLSPLHYKARAGL